MVLASFRSRTPADSSDSGRFSRKNSVSAKEFLLHADNLIDAIEEDRCAVGHRDAPLDIVAYLRRKHPMRTCILTPFPSKCP